MTKNKKNIPYELSDYALTLHFQKTGKRQGWLHSSDMPMLIAISGGGDSVALLWLFKTFYEGKIISAHINHSIRGKEADEDAKFVRELSCSWGVELLEKKISVPDERQKGESLEAAARRIRHRELAEMARGCGAYGIALGHNRDDLAETVLFNILRGTGIRGSVGIPECGEISGGIKVFRPLIDLGRDFLREILRVRGISWREDCTNEDKSYTRNFIRLELMPLISKKINAGAVEHLASFGEEMRVVRSYEEAQSRELIKSILISTRSENVLMSLDRRKIRTLTERSRTLLIRELGRELGLVTLSRHRCEELARLMAKLEPFVFQWSGGVNVIGQGRVINVAKNS